MTESPAPVERSRWRLSYLPGDWLALAGPRAAVVLQPASPQWSELIATVWEDVLAAESIDDLLQRMATFRLEGMPNFAAFFWADGELRSLVRGGIQLVDEATGVLVADGIGMHTWAESALAGIQRIQVKLTHPGDEPHLELPLVVGAAGVSSLIIDTDPDRQVELGLSSPPATPVKTTSDQALAIDPSRESSAEAAVVSEQTELPTEPLTEPISQPIAGPVSEPIADVTDAPEVPEPIAPTYDEDENGRTLLAPSLPGAPQILPPAPPPRVVVAVLIPSSGGHVEVDRPILVGRSPSASRVSGDQLPRLMTVPSPSHDISRTHLQVAPGDGQVLITDLNSTNGTILITPDGQQVILEPSAPVGVGFGSVIDLGDGITIRVDSPGDRPTANGSSRPSDA